ncbi:hypothetical protein RRG08_022931 [Elysia crispata]|uniref:Uncharacterized protein n=1 Tax=Elysia crispata TaxID=231223 RepID=A0AAE1CJ69_9GAST|nr:hypothetical protein RRG08_022931 [Elysia crispata]
MNDFIKENFYELKNPNLAQNIIRNTPTKSAHCPTNSIIWPPTHSDHHFIESKNFYNKPRKSQISRSQCLDLHPLVGDTSTQTSGPD